MVVGREVIIVGTINSSTTGPGYTLQESVKGSEKKEPMVVGYYQDCYYQSLKKISTTHIKSDMKKILYKQMILNYLKSHMKELYNTLIPIQRDFYLNQMKSLTIIPIKTKGRN